MTTELNYSAAQQYIDGVFAQMKEKNAHQPEFLQAAEEILLSLTPVFEQHPEFTFDDILSLLKVASTPLDIPKNQQGEGKIDINKVLQQ